jgi:hypothetical protein
MLGVEASDPVRRVVAYATWEGSAMRSGASWRAGLIEGVPAGSIFLDTRCTKRNMEPQLVRQYESELREFESRDLGTSTSVDSSSLRRTRGIRLGWRCLQGREMALEGRGYDRECVALAVLLCVCGLCRS